VELGVRPFDIVVGQNLPNDAEGESAGKARCGTLTSLVLSRYGALWFPRLGPMVIFQIPESVLRGGVVSIANFLKNSEWSIMYPFLRKIRFAWDG
jgi:hypothetical protein